MTAADRPPTYCPVWSAYRRAGAAVAETELAHTYALDRGRVRDANRLELALTYLRSARGTLERLLPRG